MGNRVMGLETANRGDYLVVKEDLAGNRRWRHIDLEKESASRGLVGFCHSDVGKVFGDCFPSRNGGVAPASLIKNPQQSAAVAALLAKLPEIDAEKFNKAILEKLKTWKPQGLSKGVDPKEFVQNLVRWNTFEKDALKGQTFKYEIVKDKNGNETCVPDREPLIAQYDAADWNEKKEYTLDNSTLGIVIEQVYEPVLEQFYGKEFFAALRGEKTAENGGEKEVNNDDALNKAARKFLEDKVSDYISRREGMVDSETLKGDIYEEDAPWKPAPEEERER